MTTGGATGTGGSATGGAGGRGGTGTGTGGAAGRGTGGGAGSGTGGMAAGGAGGAASRFSFFMTSIVAMRRESGSQNGFGGDLRFGETTGLAGADKLCAKIAEAAMTGAGTKTWRAFLSVIGPPVVNAIDRVGEGPWYDRMGRLVANNKADLRQQRPVGAHTAIVNDLPNEFGVPNHNPDGTGNVDNHDVLTGTGPMGNLYSMNASNTCNDWTSSAATAPTAGTGGSTGGGGGGRANGPWCGHSWPAQSGMNWMSALAEGGCGAGINLMEQGGPMQGVYTVGTGGGYGAIYCLALTP